LFDPFSLSPENEPDRVLVDVTDVRSRGAAASFSSRFSEAVEVRLSIATTKVWERVAGDEVVGANDRPFDTRLWMVWDPSPRWSLRFAWRVASGAPTTPLLLGPGEGGEPVPELGPLRSERLRDYQSLDLEIVRAWQLRGGRLELLLDLENAYDSHNPRGFEYEVESDPHGEAFVEREELLWPGLVPSFRLRFEF
jgi:hypothetical protein